MPDELHPKAHAAIKKPRRRLPGWAYEVGAAVAIGWTVYLTTQDWKQGVGAGLVMMFGGGAARGAQYLDGRK
jgi:hypothetical protein